MGHFRIFSELSDTVSISMLTSNCNQDADLFKCISEGQFFLHALKTPLTTLGLNLDVLNAQATAHNHDYLQASIVAFNRIKELVSFAHQAEATIFEPSPFIKEVLLLYRSSNQTVIEYGSADKIKLKGNPFIFQEILVCLINNALESYQSPQHKIATLHHFLENGQYHLQVVDAGGGMKVSDLSKNLPKGSKQQGHFGLGLAFVQSAIKNHFGGQLQLSSSRNGTTIKFWLPVAAKQSLPLGKS